MTLSPPIEPVRKSVTVKAPIAHAFEVFTSGLTRWWPPNHGIGKKLIAKVLLEPRLGGHWLEISEDGTETRVATIIPWDPPHRLIMLWQVNAQWKPDTTMRSEVDVRFTAEGANATRVELVHHKFESMGGDAGLSMRKDVAGGWRRLIESLVAGAARSRPQAGLGSRRAGVRS